MRVIAIVILALVAAFAPATSGNDGDARRIAELIKQLGDDTYARREEANKALEALGEKALVPLVEAAAAGDDLTVKRSARRLVRLALPKTRRSKTTGMTLAGVHAGEFMMGSLRGEPGRRVDEQHHHVRLTRPYFIGAHEVAQDEYEQVMKANPSWFSPDGGGKAKLTEKTPRYPVEQVTWFDALEFCNRLSALDGLPPHYKLADVKREGGAITAADVTVSGGNGYRLPSEAEWEYACRAGTLTAFHYGAASQARDANVMAIVSGGYGGPSRRLDLERTAKVGSYNPNRWGLYCAHGNVAEWCFDWYDKDYYGNSPAEDPKGPAKGTHRVLRGGSWSANEVNARSASRFYHVPGGKTYTAGFRVARNP